MQRVVLVSVVVSSMISTLATLAVVSFVSPSRADAQGQTVRASAFVLVGRDGSTRALLGEAPDGSAGLDLRDRQGQQRATVVVGSNGYSALTVLDQNETIRAALTVIPDGTPMLLLNDAQGIVHLQAGVTSPNSPEISLLGDNGRPLWSAP